MPSRTHNNNNNTLQQDLVFTTKWLEFSSFGS